MGGVCTPTEAGRLQLLQSAGQSFCQPYLKVPVSQPGYRRSLLLATVNSAAPLLLIIACARVFSYGLTALQMPVIVNDLILFINK